MLRAGSAIAPDSPALTFFAEASRFQEATVWSHRELFRRVTQAGNLFRRLGVERGDAVAVHPAESAGNASRDLGRRGGRDRLRDQPSPRSPAAGGASEGGRAEASGDARPDARDRSLDKGDGRRRRARTISARCSRSTWRLTSPQPKGRRSALCAELDRPRSRFPCSTFAANWKRSRRRARFRAAEARRHLLLLLHRRHDRRAKNRAAHPFLGGVRRLGDDLLQ